MADCISGDTPMGIENNKKDRDIKKVKTKSGEAEADLT